MQVAELPWQFVDGITEPVAWLDVRDELWRVTGIYWSGRRGVDMGHAPLQGRGCLHLQTWRALLSID